MLAQRLLLAVAVTPLRQPLHNSYKAGVTFRSGDLRPGATLPPGRHVFPRWRAASFPFGRRMMGDDRGKLNTLRGDRSKLVFMFRRRAHDVYSILTNNMVL